MYSHPEEIESFRVDVLVYEDGFRVDAVSEDLDRGDSKVVSADDGSLPVAARRAVLQYLEEHLADHLDDV